MEACIDDQRDTKKQLYEIFKQRPELLVPVTEGLTHTEQRQVVRDCLMAVLDAGVKPMELFDSDIRKYIYLAELAAPIDLSLVRASGYTGRLMRAVACRPQASRV